MTHAVDAHRLEFEAQDIADSLAALHGIDVERLLHSPDEMAQRQKERAHLEDRRHRLAKLYMGWGISTMRLIRRGEMK